MQYMGVRYLMGCAEYWRGLQVDLHPTHIAFAGGQRGHYASVAVVAEEDFKAVRKGKPAHCPAGWRGWLGGGRQAGLDGWQLGMAGRAG